MTDAPGRAPVLVVGYGNDLRSDDGAGRWVADRIEARGLAHVDVRSVMQLTPELALEVVDRELVVFVDASVDTDRLRIEDVEPAPGATVMTHHGDPASLLSMASMLGTAPARSLVVSIPAVHLEMGHTFSPRADAAAHEALDHLLHRLDTAR